jgi:hypothetical protein
LPLRMTSGSNRLNEFAFAARVAVEDGRALACFITLLTRRRSARSRDPAGAERIRAELESRACGHPVGARTRARGARAAATRMKAREHQARCQRKGRPANALDVRSRCRSLRKVRRAQKVQRMSRPDRKGKRFIGWRGSHYREAAGARRVDRRVEAVAVLVLAACGHAPQ